MPKKRFADEQLLCAQEGLSGCLIGLGDLARIQQLRESFAWRKTKSSISSLE